VIASQLIPLAQIVCDKELASGIFKKSSRQSAHSFRCVNAPRNQPSRWPARAGCWCASTSRRWITHPMAFSPSPVRRAPQARRGGAGALSCRAGRTAEKCQEATSKHDETTPVCSGLFVEVAIRSPPIKAIYLSASSVLLAPSRAEPWLAASFCASFNASRQSTGALVLGFSLRIHDPRREFDDEQQRKCRTDLFHLLISCSDGPSAD